MSTATFSGSSSPKNSTTVRPTSSSPPERSRVEQALYTSAWPLRALARVSPALAGRAAARAFFTTYRPPVRPAEAALLATAERVEVPFGKQRLATWVLGDGPTVLLTHGWNGRAAQLAPLVGALATAGFRAVVFDHPGHGESPGSWTTIPEMVHALSEVDGWLGGAHAVVGHSMGAVLVTLAQARTIRPKRVVFIASPIEPTSWPKAFARRLGLPPSVDRAMLAAVEARAGTAITTIDPRPLLPTLSAPLLVVHDRSDREVPFSAGATIAATCPDAELLATDGLGHHKVLRDPQVGERVLAFLAPLTAPHRRT